MNSTVLNNSKLNPTADSLVARQNNNRPHIRKVKESNTALHPAVCVYKPIQDISAINNQCRREGEIIIKLDKLHIIIIIAYRLSDDINTIYFGFSTPYIERRFFLLKIGRHSSAPLMIVYLAFGVSLKPLPRINTVANLLGR